MTVLTPYPTHGPAALEEADIHSYYMRILFEEIPLKQDLDNRLTVEDLPQNNNLKDQARINYLLQPQSTEIEDGNSLSISSPAGQQPVLVEYFN